MAALDDEAARIALVRESVPSRNRVARKPVASRSPSLLPSPGNSSTSTLTPTSVENEKPQPYEQTTAAGGDEGSQFLAPPAKKSHALALYSRLASGKSSLPRDVHDGSQKKIRQLFAWLPEIGWCVLSVALLVALVVILRMYDDQQLPQWPLGLTLNTVVALLSTICRTAFVIAVSDGLSQLKWNWFAGGRPRPLRDMELFDQASRGPWGSIMVVLTWRGRFLGLLPAIVLVSGLATSTLTQSAISYSTRPVEAAGLAAQSFSRRHYPAPTNQPGHDRQDMVDNTVRALFQAVFGPIDKSWPLLEPSCPSSDCTWPVFSSLAVCVAMENVTHLLDITSSGRPAFSSSNEYTAKLRGVNASMTTLEEWPLVQMISPEPPDFPYSFPPDRTSLGFKDRMNLVNTTFSQFFFIYNNDNASPFHYSFRAVELLWHFCVNTYNVTVSGGVTNTTVLSSRSEIKEIASVPDLAAGTGSHFMRLGGPKDEDTFIVDSQWEYTRLDLDMRRAFEGNWGPTVSTGWPYTEANRQFGSRIFTGKSNLTADATEKLMWDGIKGISQAMADSMTNLIRQTGEVEVGQVIIPVTYIIVRWEWLSFLAAQVALSVIFLVAIAIHTSLLGVPVVKSSALAGLLAVPACDKASMESREEEHSTITGLNASVDAVAKLERDGSSWKLAVGVIDGDHDEPKRSGLSP